VVHGLLVVAVEVAQVFEDVRGWKATDG